MQEFICAKLLLGADGGKTAEFGNTQTRVGNSFWQRTRRCVRRPRKGRSLYNPADYPPLEYVEQQFTFIWQYISFGVPDQLREISTKIWQDEREKAAEVMAEAGRDQQVLHRRWPSW